MQILGSPTISVLTLTLILTAKTQLIKENSQGQLLTIF